MATDTAPPTEFLLTAPPRPSDDAPAWRRDLWAEYWNRENWEISAKGNHALISAEHGTVTLFLDRFGKGWTWCIARSKGPQYAPDPYPTEGEACAGAYEALVALVDEGERRRLDGLAQSVRDLHRHFMNPANWTKTPERFKGGQEYTIMIDGLRCAMVERNDGRWLWGVSCGNVSMVTLDQVVTTHGLDEANARHGAWKALVKQIVQF